MIEGDYKVIIDYYNKKNNLPCSIILLMEDIWKLSQSLNIHEYNHNYREINKIVDCLTKKDIDCINSTV